MLSGQKKGRKSGRFLVLNRVRVLESGLHIPTFFGESYAVVTQYFLVSANVCCGGTIARRGIRTSAYEVCGHDVWGVGPLPNNTYLLVREQITCPHDLKFKLLPRKNRVEKDMRAGVQGFGTRKNFSNMFLR